ncbi:hypothetical protein V7075_29115 [Neobacillus drentensis]|uniref:HNH endonuclease n=1 Tax=Neobacillus drentensis TaxID=220684 RepID=UPI002FFD7E2F
MGKQRCLNCYVIKDTQYFSLDRRYCDGCVRGTTVNCTRCGSPFESTTPPKNTICQKCLNQINSINTKIIKKNPVNKIKTSGVKDTLMNEVIELVLELEIEEIPGFEDINFTDISVFQLRNLSKDDLSLLLDNLYEIQDAYSMEDIEEEDIEEVETDFIDALDIIRKYKKLLDVKMEKNKPVEKWRLNIPKYIKVKVKNWRSESIHSIYEKSKVLMTTSTGQNKEEIMDFVCDLSEIIFEEPVKEKIPLEDKGRVEDWVLSHIEMTILPQLEAIDRLENNHGILIFDDSCTNDLTQALIEEVHERDGRHCFICHDRNNLKLHQIITYESGKTYHKDNLVTLCNSCKNAIITRSVNKAFTQCLRNFYENY